MSSIKLTADSGGGTVELKAPATTTSNAALQFKLPVADGTSGQALTTNASGQLAFATVAGGKILQVVSTESSATVTSTGTTLQLLTISITPAATSSKILILATHSIEGVPSSNAYGTIYLYRGALGATQIFNTTAGDNHASYNYANININYVDSPSTTSAQSYTTGINRGSGNTTSASTNGTKYTLIAMEIGA